MIIFMLCYLCWSVVSSTYNIDGKDDDDHDDDVSTVYATDYTLSPLSIYPSIIHSAVR
jgi:hypothetical protein